MKRSSWLCWLLALASVACLSEAQYKFRRPQFPPPPPPLPPPQIFKKSWAPGPRIPPMGNSIHIGGGPATVGGNFPHKRPLFKPPNYRFRRPPGLPPPPPPSAMFNVLPSSYKNPIPPSLGMMNNYGASLGQQQQQQQPQTQPQLQPQPQRVKEFHSIAKLPQQYSPEYRPELASLSSHRAGLDDDKGPIHTIPAPNLGPASKSYQQQQQALFNGQESQGEEQRRPYTVTQVDFATVFNGQESSVTPQRVVPSNPTPTNNFQHHYEVTESNEVNSLQPTYFTPEFDPTQYASSIIQEQQQQQQQQQLDAGNGATLQANLHSSMHVGASTGAGISVQDQVSDLHVGQPGAVPPVSAAKLYEVLNAFPQHLTEQYALNQQPQIQQHLLQQQLSQILQQQEDQTKASFSQPMLHSFNYDEQANKQKQQQSIFVDQNYAAGRVTADYSLAPETPDVGHEVPDASEQHENNIEFENPVGQVRPTTYFTKLGEDASVASTFYTTLPNREAAEKLAALAAAGNVNSQLIGQLRKQQQEAQQQQQQSQSQPQSDQPMPANHKDGNDHNERQRQQQEHRQKLFHRRQKIREQELARREEEEEKYKQHSQEEDKRRPLRILVPEKAEKQKEIVEEDYEYENDEADVSREHEPSSEDSEFGSRIVSKTG